MLRTLGILLLVLVSCNSFLINTRTKLNNHRLFMGFEKEIGVQPPLGFFDPLGYLNDADQKEFDRLRYCELKHGRIAMLAVLGHIITTKGDRFPGLAAFKDIPLAGTLQLILFIGCMEAGFATVEKEIEAYCLKQAKGRGWSDEKIRQKKAIELNNGRAAQMGILTLVVHEILNNDPYVINSLLGFPVAFNK